MKTYNTLSEAINSLINQGYIHDFNLHADWIECAKLDLRLNPEEFHVDEVHRFEGMTNPDDNEVLYAISSTRGVKGLLVDAYGVYSHALSSGMVMKLTIDGVTRR